MKHLKMPHGSVRPTVRKAWTQAEGSARLLLPEEEPGKLDLPSPFVKGRQCSVWGFLRPSLPWINLGGNNLLGLYSGHTKTRCEQIHPPIFTDILYGPGLPVILIFSMLVGCTVGSCLSSDRHFLTRKCLSLLLWEVGSSPRGRCALVCYLQPDGTHGKWGVGVEGGCDRHVTAPGAASPAPGVLDMLPKQNRNSRKLLKYRSCLWAWHGETLFFLERAPSHASSRGNSVSALLAFAVPCDSGSCH